MDTAQLHSEKRLERLRKHRSELDERQSGRANGKRGCDGEDGSHRQWMPARMGDDAFRPAPIPLTREQQVHLAIAPDQTELPNPLERLFGNASTWRSLPTRGGDSERIRDRRHVGTEGPALESCLVVSDPGKSGRPVSHPESRSGDMRHDHLHRMPGSSRFVHSCFIHVLLHPCPASSMSCFIHGRRRPVRNAQPSSLFTLEDARSSPRLTRDSQVR